MKNFPVLLVAIALVLLPVAARAEVGQEPGGVPPIPQKLIREGDLAVELANALNVGSVDSEEEAESRLAAAGIAPKNGWVADYPVSPDIIGELETAMATAADSDTLQIGRDEALASFDDLLTQMGLPITSDGSEEYKADTQPPVSSEGSTYADSEGLADYYRGSGPPIVTYYTPPWPYDSLYSWVPYPFSCNGFFFSGFFVLRHFHDTVPVVVVHHHGSRVVIISGPVWKIVTNRVANPFTHKVVIIDPARRSIDPTFRFASSSLTSKAGAAQPRPGSTVVVEEGLARQGLNPSPQRRASIQPSAGSAVSSSRGPKIVSPTRVGSATGSFPVARRGSLAALRGSGTSFGRAFRSIEPGRPAVSSSSMGAGVRAQVPAAPAPPRVAASNVVPESAHVPPAKAGRAPEGPMMTGHGWGQWGNGFGAGRMQSSGSWGGFGRR
ncbi:MAG TPA: hypothetical protein VEI04_10505 [Syntrophobacteria bacterium]|nr:hypothetical protein [Syntrophobacteria bacterium]